MTTERFSNQASTTLASSIGAGDLSISVQGVVHFPTQPEFRVRVGQELMLVTGVTGVIWTVTRGIEGTSALSHAVGTSVVAVLTAGALDELRAEIEAENLKAGSLVTTTTSVVVSGAAAPSAGQVLTATSGTAAAGGGNINVGGSITNFDNGHTVVDVALPTNASTSVLPVVLPGLGASKKYTATLGCRVVMYTDADHTVAGSIDLVIDVNIATDGSSVATSTLTGTPSPDTSRLPAGLAGATATVAASAGGFTISATRPTGVACHAKARWWTNTFEDLT